MRRESVRAFAGGRGLHGIVSVALGIAACTPHAGSLTPAPPVHARSGLCELLASPPAAAASLRITVTDAINAADAPIPRTDAERVIFPLLYPPTSSSSGTCHDRSQPTTGGYEIARAADTALDLVPHRSTRGPALHVSRIPVEGGRDALDGGTDVLITSDATTIAYAAAQAEFASVPLPWSRVYVLMQPAAPAHIDRDTVRALDGDLAADAVPVEARPVDDSQWGEALGPCDTVDSMGRVAAPDASPSSVATSASVSGGPLVNSIIYPDDDNVARAVSERLVALANDRDPRVAAVASALIMQPAVRAAGFDSAHMRSALASGRDAAYIASIHVSGICRDVAILIAEAPWLGSDLHHLGATLIPLIETRAHAIVRRGRVGVAVDDAGDVYLEFGPATGS